MNPPQDPSYTLILVVVLIVVFVAVIALIDRSKKHIA
jgi:hypothetical protein